MNIININESDFNMAWTKLISNLIKSGEESIIGDHNDQHTVIGSCGMIQLSGNAIKQIESFEIHPDYPFKAIRQYADQFTYEWQNKNGTGGFSYTYFSRLTDYNNENYNVIDQLDDLRYGLKKQIDNNMSSNRNHAITWTPELDSYSSSPPCLQSLNVKYVGNNKVDIFLYWRSRDAYTAWQSNLIAIVEMINKYVIRPNSVTIRSLIDFCNNYHIYNSDFATVKQVKFIPLNPQNNYW